MELITSTIGTVAGPPYRAARALLDLPRLLEAALHRIEDVLGESRRRDTGIEETLAALVAQLGELETAVARMAADVAPLARESVARLDLIEEQIARIAAIVERPRRRSPVPPPAGPSAPAAEPPVRRFGLFGRRRGGPGDAPAGA